MSEVTVKELEIKIALIEDLIKSGKGRINEVCVGCGKARSRLGLSSDGYHFDCKPCKGCGQTRDGVGLSSDGYHFDCKPCKGCGQTRDGVGLVDGEYHYRCN